MNGKRELHNNYRSSLVTFLFGGVAFVSHSVLVQERFEFYVREFSTLYKTRVDGIMLFIFASMDVHDCNLTKFNICFLESLHTFFRCLI